MYFLKTAGTHTTPLRSQRKHLKPPPSLHLATSVKVWRGFRSGVTGVYDQHSGEAEKTLVTHGLNLVASLRQR